MKQFADGFNQIRWGVFLLFVERTKVLHYVTLTKYNDDPDWDFASYILKTYISPSLLKCVDFIENCYMNPDGSGIDFDMVDVLEKELLNNSGKLNLIKDVTVKGIIANILAAVPRHK